MIRINVFAEHYINDLTVAMYGMAGGLPLALCVLKTFTESCYGE